MTDDHHTTKSAGGCGWRRSQLCPSHMMPLPRARLTVTSYGGTWEKAQREIYAPVFKSRNAGWDVDVQLGGPPQWLSQIEANASAPPIHVIVHAGRTRHWPAAQRACSRRSASTRCRTRRTCRSHSSTCRRLGRLLNYGAAVFGYHKERVKNPPKSYKEFVERAARGDFAPHSPASAGRSRRPSCFGRSRTPIGGGVDNVTPGFEAVKRMRPNSVFWNSVTEFTATAAVRRGGYRHLVRWPHLGCLRCRREMARAAQSRRRALR